MAALYLSNTHTQDFMSNIQTTGLPAAAGQRDDSPLSPDDLFSWLFFRGEYHLPPSVCSDAGPAGLCYDADWEWEVESDLFDSSHHGESRFPDLSGTFAPPPAHMLSAPVTSFPVPTILIHDTDVDNDADDEDDDDDDDEEGGCRLPADDSIPSHIAKTLSKANIALSLAETPAVEAFVNDNPTSAATHSLIETMLALDDAATDVRTRLAEVRAGRQESYGGIWIGLGRIEELVQELDEAVAAIEAADCGPSTSSSSSGYFPVMDARGDIMFVRGPIGKELRLLDLAQFPECLTFVRH
ncbi:hypothetical protein MAPG_11460 [Magnaporthiopsis poae ATCC 64411]|uniref:Uncharacterized protein n=1 Tax=Magnaporthiopsis poae (strain ATCC 64411 / 73-15) TaxID=644358 RepID=A0A0C4EFB8_MAGP6|nr:hypothetical protein MAPG_11460 [Magnaporthiopsis poae ATCC 64411]